MTPRLSNPALGARERRVVLVGAVIIAMAVGARGIGAVARVQDSIAAELETAQQHAERLEWIALNAAAIHRAHRAHRLAWERDSADALYSLSAGISSSAATIELVEMATAVGLSVTAVRLMDIATLESASVDRDLIHAEFLGTTDACVQFLLAIATAPRLYVINRLGVAHDAGEQVRVEVDVAVFRPRIDVALGVHQ